MKRIFFLLFISLFIISCSLKEKNIEENTNSQVILEKSTGEIQEVKDIKNILEKPKDGTLLIFPEIIGKEKIDHFNMNIFKDFEKQSYNIGLDFFIKGDVSLILNHNPNYSSEEQKAILSTYTNSGTYSNISGKVLKNLKEKDTDREVYEVELEKQGDFIPLRIDLKDNGKGITFFSSVNNKTWINDRNKTFEIASPREINLDLSTISKFIDSDFYFTIYDDRILDDVYYLDKNAKKKKMIFDYKENGSLKITKSKDIFSYKIYFSKQGIKEVSNIFINFSDNSIERKEYFYEKSKK